VRAVPLLALLLSAAPVYAPDAAENTLSQTYGPTFKQPNIKKNHSNHGADVGQFRTNFEHSGAWTYGTTRLDLGVQQSNGQDPAARRRVGATQVYGAALVTLSGNRVLGGRPFDWGPISDVRLDFGSSWNTKNSSLENRKKEIMFGVSLAFHVPGVLTIGAHIAQEWNHNGIVGRNFAYHPAALFTAYYEQAFELTGLPLRLRSAAVVETPKGPDGFGRQTTFSFLSLTMVALDIGDLLLHRPGRFDALFGFQYWLNKAGDDHTIKSGSVEETALFGVAYHF
jgi:hypothetical protein